jgi:small subunit ribosomal protein S1
LFVEGLKSEPVLDVNELKSMGLGEKIKGWRNYSSIIRKN